MQGDLPCPVALTSVFPCNGNWSIAQNFPDLRLEDAFSTSFKKILREL
jgi:hypothetical protein